MFKAGRTRVEQRKRLENPCSTLMFTVAIRSELSGADLRSNVVFHS